MCGGGGGSTGTTKYEWNDSLKGPWEGSVNRAIWESERPFEAYQGGDPNARIAQLSPLHNKAAGNMEAMTDAVGNPTFAINAAQNQASDTLAGNYLMGGNSNPYTRPNQFQGMNNSFFNADVDRGMSEISQHYQTAIEPETRAQMVMNGTLGGGAHQQITDRNQAALGKSLADYNTQRRNTQYDRSATLDEAALGRGMQAFEGERGRMIGAIGGGYGAQDAAMGRLQGLMQMGDMGRSYDQDVKNYGYQNYMDKRNENRYGLDFLTGLMGRAQGGFSNLTTTAPQYQVSPYSALMSGAMAYGALR
jgi:hypothetical protein